MFLHHVHNAALSFLPAAQFALSLWNTRWSVPPVNREIFMQRLTQLAAVMDEIEAAPQVRERMEMIGDLKARFGDPPGPSTWVLSTGRCGTRALHYLFERSQSVKSYHRGMTLFVGSSDRNEMLYRILLGGLDPGFVRAAAIRFFAYNFNDMAYCLRNRKQYCVTMHGHTIFAPFAARLFPESQFIWLKRAPLDVLHSYIAKGQYRNQLEPRYVDTWFLHSDRKYKAHRTTFRSIPALWSMHRKVLWYIHVTDSFAGAFTDSVGPERAVAIDSERLFAGDEEIYRRLRDRMALSDLSLAQYQQHFATPLNAKSHRARPAAVADGRIDRSVSPLLERLARTGTY